ncbi:MAG TPA: hypothetical protein VIK52_05820 [Opitutaceae bacterium]
MRRILCFRLTAIFLIAAAFARADERNFWPFVVNWTDDANKTSHTAVVGPLGFAKRPESGPLTKGFRPLFVTKSEAGRKTGHVLYPLLNWDSSEAGRQGDIFKLIRWSNIAAGSSGALRTFEVWPFYLSRETGDPETSYQGVMPFYGTVKNRFGNDRIDWVLFPLYGRFEQKGIVTTTTPWPFIKHVSGDATGFEVWPLFGSRGKEGVFKETFALWPFYHHNERILESGAATEELAVLPFYMRSRGEFAVSETYLWPFFGYTLSEAPAYREQRWFWPFVVTARGEDRRVDRVAPFFTHSVRKGVRKTWVLWPLVRNQQWNEADLEIEKTQLLYFLYWNLEQRSATNPSLAPASKTHLWPLLSHWDNGAGHTQLQLFSPLEVFFQHNEVVRTVYSPLFSIYRLDHRPSGDVHGSYLFNFMTYHREGEVREFNLGPLFETERDGGGLRRVTLFKVLHLYSRGPRSEPKP